MIYLDTAATGVPRREAIEAMLPYLTGQFGNPSSRHAAGRAAADALEAARKSVAESLNARSSEIVFTSGGTEADNLAIKGIALANPRGRHIVTTRLEHAAVLESVDYLVRHHDFEVSFAEPDHTGMITPEQLQKVLRADTTLVSIHFANNEIGTIQPIKRLAALSDVPFHTDAVQAAGWLDLDVRDLGVDALVLSGHKFGAPKGTGVLWVRGRVALEPVLHGGGHERGLRSGTENVAGAVALATALRASLHDDHTHTAGLRNHFVRTVLTEGAGARLTGHPESRVPGSASFVFDGVGGEAVLLELEERGVMCSSGSACDADSEDASPVLLAIGVPEDLARTAVRFSFSPSTTAAEADAAADAVIESVRTVRALV